MGDCACDRTPTDPIPGAPRRTIVDPMQYDRAPWERLRVRYLRCNRKATFSIWHETSTRRISTSHALFTALSTADGRHLLRDDSVVDPPEARSGRHEGALSDEPHSSTFDSSSTRHDADTFGSVPWSPSVMASAWSRRAGDEYDTFSSGTRAGADQTSVAASTDRTIVVDIHVRTRGTRRKQRLSLASACLVPYLPPPAYPKYHHACDGRNAAVRRTGPCPRWSAGH